MSGVVTAQPKRANFLSTPAQRLLDAAKNARPDALKYNRLTWKEFGDKNSGYV